MFGCRKGRIHHHFQNFGEHSRLWPWKLSYVHHIRGWQIWDKLCKRIWIDDCNHWRKRHSSDLWSQDYYSWWLWFFLYHRSDGIFGEDFFRCIIRLIIWITTFFMHATRHLIVTIWHLTLTLLLSRSITDGRTLLRYQMTWTFLLFIRLHHLRDDWSERRPLDFLHKEYFILVKLFVQRKLTRLPKCFSAALIWTFEWFLTCVDISMFFEVLAQRELLIADHACKCFGRSMRRNMPAQWKSSCELLITIFVFAFERSLHVFASCSISICF